MPEINYRDAKKRLDAVQKLFSQSSTTLEKARSVVALLKGLNPRMDAVISEYQGHLATIENLAEGSVLTLSAEKLPETTEEEKKRKKFMLLFLKNWNALKGEVARVQGELERPSNGNKPTQDLSMWSRIFHAAKGPLGIVTVIAVGIAILHTTSVSIMVVNSGCNIIEAKSTIPISIPGFRLPNESIPPGGSATVVVPPFPLEVNGTIPGVISITSLKFDFSIKLSSSISDVTFNGASLIGKKSNIDLSGQKTHTLKIVCET